MGLGSTASFSLDEARERARGAKRLLTDNIDPLEASRAEHARQPAEAAKDKTFADVTGFEEARKTGGTHVWCGYSCGRRHRRVREATAFFEAWAIYRDNPQEKTSIRITVSCTGYLWAGCPHQSSHPLCRIAGSAASHDADASALIKLSPISVTAG